MRISTKIISVAASAALIAGAGALAATPASAHKGDTIKGASTISLPPALVAGLAGAGVTLAATGGGAITVDGSTGYANATFPVVKPIQDGKINHRGVLEITSSVTGVTLTLTNPVITYGTDGTGTLGGTLNGLPSWMEPFASALNGTFREPFTISDLDLSVTVGKVTKRGKGFVRVDKVKASGMLAFVDSQDSANIFNTALFGPTGTPVFTPGMALGGASTSFAITHTCKTVKECKV